MDAVRRVATRWVEANTGLFIRFGQWRSSEQSYNYQTETWEKGVSVFRGRKDMRPKLHSKNWPRDESVYLWDPQKQQILSTSKWDLEEGLEPTPV